jgi:hypothetical protein
MAHTLSFVEISCQQCKSILSSPIVHVQPSWVWLVVLEQSASSSGPTFMQLVALPSTVPTSRRPTSRYHDESNAGIVVMSMNIFHVFPVSYG